MARLRPSVAQALGWDAGDSSEVYGTGSSSFHHGVHPASVYVGWGRRWEDRSSVGHASLRTDVLPVARRGLMDHPREREDRPGRGLAPRRRRHVSDSASEAHGSDDRAVASEASEASEASTASAFVSDLESSADSAESAGEATSGPADADASCWRKSDGAKWEIFHKALAAVSEAVRADEPWAGRHGARSSLAPRADGSGGEGKDEGDKSGGEESAEEEQEEEQDEQEEEGGVESGGEGTEEGEEEEEEEDAFVDASTTAPQCGIARGGVPVAADEAWRRAIAHLHGLWTAWAAETRAASSAVSRLEAERSALRHRLQRQRAAWRADRGRLRMCEAAEASARRRASQFERELRRVEARGQRWRQAVEAKLSEVRARWCVCVCVCSR